MPSQACHYPTSPSSARHPAPAVVCTSSNVCLGDEGVRQLSWSPHAASRNGQQQSNLAGASSSALGVAVLVLGVEQACHFVVRFRPNGCGMEFLRDPVQFINDPLLWSRNGAGHAPPASDGTTPASQEDVLARTFYQDVWRSISKCQTFRQSTTWWYRLDETTKTLLASHRGVVLPEGPVGTDDLLSTSDPRWTGLPVGKLLRNKNWNDRPEYLAKEMRYGLLEIF